MDVRVGLQRKLSTILKGSVNYFTLRVSDYFFVTGKTTITSQQNSKSIQLKKKEKILVLFWRTRGFPLAYNEHLKRAAKQEVNVTQERIKLSSTFKSLSYVFLCTFILLKSWIFWDFAGQLVTYMRKKEFSSYFTA